MLLNQCLVERQAEEIGKKIQKARRSRGLSRKRLAQELGMNYVALYQWERGKNIKGIIKFFELCKALDVKPDQFFPHNHN